jgi:hypothetical protein
MDVAYPRTVRAARRAFRHWRSCKIEDALAECVGKVFDSRRRLLLRERDPEPLLPGLIKYAILWVRYDRKIAGRSRMPDVYDYRSHMRQQFLSEQGEASASDRSSSENPWIDWHVQAGDNPGELVAALEGSGSLWRNGATSEAHLRPRAGRSPHRPASALRHRGAKHRPSSKVGIGENPGRFDLAGSPPPPGGATTTFRFLYMRTRFSIQEIRQSRSPEKSP